MGQTEHYGLYQWGHGDSLRHREVNQNFIRIETALNGLSSSMEMYTQTITTVYTGTGVGSRVINLGFQPKAVLVERADTRRAGTDYTIISGLILNGHPAQQYAGFPSISIVSNGVTLHEAEVNETGVVYHILAFR